MEMVEVGSSAASWSLSVVVSPQASDAVIAITSATTGTRTRADLNLLIGIPPFLIDSAADRKRG
jgi:hypothetical protein